MDMSFTTITIAYGPFNNETHQVEYIPEDYLILASQLIARV